MSSNYIPNPGIPPQPQTKKMKPLLWILAGCGTLMVLAVAIVIAIGAFGWYSFKNSEWSKNPQMAAARFALSQNPAIEVVSMDDEKSTITIKEKSTGKVITMNAEDISKGKISFSENGKETFTIQANEEGKTGNIEFKSDKGTMKIGGSNSVELPEWVPSYPGSTPEGNFSMNSDEGTTQSFSFTTQDSAENVIEFYETGLKNAGLKVTKGTYNQGGITTGTVAASDDDQKRTASIAATNENNETKVNVTFMTKSK
jgi:hypothetical protein